MHLSEIRLDENLRELTVRGEPGYPVAMYDNDMDGFLGGSVPWHWHKEIEFAYVHKGGMTVEAGEQKVALMNGQGVFLNSGVLHCMYRENSPLCKMITIAFDPLLLSGAETSIYHSRYILPLIQCQAIPVLWITGERTWHNDLKKRLECAFDAYERNDFGCEFTVRQLLSEAWFIILKENAPLLEKKQQEPKDGRLKQMLHYIQMHIAEPLRLKDIAASGNVSERECTRCFQNMLGITPILYLTQLRIRSAALLLESTEDSITEIAMAVGFENPAYFSTVFRHCTGYSPREYRKTKYQRK